MKYIRSWALAAVASAALAACGGGSGGDDPPPARGTLITGQLAGQATTQQIDAGTTASGIIGLTQAAECNVDIRYVLYMTRDPAGQPATASAAVFVPSAPTGSTDPNCTGSRPIVLYAHGTSTTKSYNIADITPGKTAGTYENAAGAEGSLIAAMYAAHGFIVVAPNYLGYDVSSATYHPYLNEEADAVDMVDALRAAKTHLSAAGVTPADALFVTGYSEGGYVAMATDKIIGRDYGSEFKVTASLPMSGPYNLVGFGDAVITAQPNAGATLFVPLMVTSYQNAYGNVYTAPTDVYASQYAATAPTLFPTDTPIDTLIANGELPNDPTFTDLFGTGGLLNPAFKQSYGTSGFRQDLVTNTLVGVDAATGKTISWAPTHPIAVCGGTQDPTVFWQVNGAIVPQTMSTAALPVPAFNVEDQASLAPLDAVQPGTSTLIYGGFQQALAAAGTNAQAEYHGTLVPPFCNAIARGFFAAQLAAQ